MTDTPRLVQIELRRVPVGLWHRARLWFEGLQREFDILAADTDDTTPRDLLEFVAETRERFSGFSRAPNAALEQALRRDERWADIELELPSEAAAAARQLWSHLERAEDYCRRGEMLSLTMEDEVRRFVRWYLEEVAAQIEGSSAQPWAGDSEPPTR